VSPMTGLNVVEICAPVGIGPQPTQLRVPEQQECCCPKLSVCCLVAVVRNGFRWEIQKLIRDAARRWKNPAHYAMKKTTCSAHRNGRLPEQQT
jgi:hypothetical protein